MKLKRLKTGNLRLKCLDDNCATTKLCYKLLDDDYLGKNGRIKENLKFKINIPRFKIQNSKLTGKPEDKFETYLFLPSGEGRKGEGGLRTKGYFKFSYKKGTRGKGEGANDEAKGWWIVDESDNFIEGVNLPETVLQQLSTNNHELTQLPLITVITVVLNGAKHLEETIQSVINQTYPNVEYIIIDGGSTDGTLDIIKKYEDKIDYWVSEKDRGISDAFNKGVILSSGMYINFQGDGDGFCNSNSISELMKDVKNVWLVSGEIVRTSKSGKPIFTSKHKPIFNKIELLFRMPFPHQGLFTKKEFFERYGLFDASLKYSMDYEILLRAFKRFPSTIRKNVVVARWREDGLGTNRIPEVLKEYYKIKQQNKIAPSVMLKGILFYNLSRFYIEKTFSLLNDSIKHRSSDRTYDYLILTYIPSFYKINFFNQLSKILKIKVIFIGENFREREGFFIRGDHTYEYLTLSKAIMEKRRIYLSLIKLLREIKTTRYRKLIICGWDISEFWLAAFLSPNAKNCLLVESNINDSDLRFWKKTLKMIFLNRISVVFTSSELSKNLLSKLKFKRNIFITKGVGIINKEQCYKLSKEKYYSKYQGRFIFVGRFVPEKNLEVLIEIFNSLPNLRLTLVGDGPLRNRLVNMAKNNISFHPPLPNVQILKYIKKHDFLTLPSIKEPWGLVVEEALYCGVPVIVSQRCGVQEIIIHGKNGYLFDPFNPTELKKILTDITEDRHREMVSYIKHSTPVEKKDKHQVNTYLKALNV